MKFYYLRIFILLLLSVKSITSFSAVYYVANNGSDAAAGTIDQPFLTIQRGQTAVVAGDTVYIRGGVYAMAESQIAQYSSIWAYVTLLNKSGTSGHRINYWAYPGERPVFNYTAINPANYRITAFQVNGSWLYIKGLEVVGVQVNITAHTQSECFENQGSNNIYEMLSMHDGKAIGYYLTKGGNNLVLNCDAYNNWDNISENKLGGNTDGFGCHPNNDGVGYTNNIFRGCRAWFNSDDGYDCINAFESIIFENCWAFYNGYSTSFSSLGDGNGFKGGGYGISTTPSVPTIIPRNTIRFCLSVRNKSSGFYANHHLGGNNWYNNSAYYNAVNYNMLNRSADYTTDVPGYDHNMKNNVGFGGRSTEYNNLDFTKCKADTNYFNLPVLVNDADFLSMDQSLLSAPRQADGSLPNNNFMKLVAGSDLINKGANIGFAYNGTAPDLGCYESGYELLPVDLLTFNATVYNSTNVLLNWKVANQIQNTGWNIERTTSLNNNNDWLKIGFVAGDNLQQTAYAFKDENLLKGNYQYRLKQIDKDGSFKYSKIIIVTIDLNNKATLSLYPNPIITDAVVKYTIPFTSNVQFNLYDADGRLIKKLLDTMQGAGLNTFIITKKLIFMRGNYLLKLYNNNKVETVMFMKN